MSTKKRMSSKSKATSTSSHYSTESSKSLKSSLLLAILVCALTLAPLLVECQRGDNDNDDFDDAGFDDSGYNSPQSHDAEGSNQNQNYSPSSEEDLDDDDDVDETNMSPQVATGHDNEADPSQQANGSPQTPDNNNNEQEGEMNNNNNNQPDYNQYQRQQRYPRQHQHDYQQAGGNQVNNFGRPAAAGFPMEALATMGPQQFYNSPDAMMLANLHPAQFDASGGFNGHQPRYRRSISRHDQEGDDQQAGDIVDPDEEPGGAHVRNKRNIEPLIRNKRHSKHYIGPVYTYVKTDKHARYKWGVKHKVGKHHG